MLSSTFFIMRELFSFLLELPNIEGTVIANLIDQNISKGKEVGALQEPKIDQFEANDKMLTPKIEKMI